MPSSLRGGDTIIDCRHVFKDGEFLPNYFYMLFPETGKYIEQACPRGPILTVKFVYAPQLKMLVDVY